jgi:hypothetical protein
MSPKFWNLKYTQLTSFPVNIEVISTRISTTEQKPKNAKFYDISSKQLRIHRNFCSVHDGLRKGEYNLIEVISNEPNK